MLWVIYLFFLHLPLDYLPSPHSNLPLPFLTSQVLCSTISLSRAPLPFFHSFFLVSEVGSTNKRAHAAVVFLGLGFLPQHGIFQFDSFAREVSDFPFLYRWIVFSLYTLPHFHYQFIGWRTLKLFPCSSYCEQSSKKHGWASIWGRTLSSLDL